MKIYEPNYTQVPNAIISIMPELSESELKVLLAIVRKTIGWQKKRDRISISQLEEMTGLGRSSICRAIQSDNFKGIVRKYETPKGNEYEMIINELGSPKSEPPNEEVVPNSNQGSTKSEPVGSPKLKHTKETITKETIQNKESEREENVLVQIDKANTIDDLLDIWRAYRKSKNKWDNIYTRQVQESKFHELGIQKVKESMLHSIGNGWCSLVEPDDIENEILDTNKHRMMANENYNGVN